jgi:hypothetical protein
MSDQLLMPPSIQMIRNSNKKQFYSLKMIKLQFLFKKSTFVKAIRLQ